MLNKKFEAAFEGSVVFFGFRGSGKEWSKRQQAKVMDKIQERVSLNI